MQGGNTTVLFTGVDLLDNGVGASSTLFVIFMLSFITIFIVCFWILLSIMRKSRQKEK